MLLIEQHVTEQLVQQAVLLDQQVYSDRYRGIPDHCINWFKKNPECYIMLMDSSPINQRLVGYINALPLEDEYIHSIEGGSIIDTELPIQSIRVYDSPGLYKIYVSSIVICNEFLDGEAISLLCTAFQTKLFELYKRGITISEIITDVVSVHGHKLAKRYGMKATIMTDHDSVIYKKILDWSDCVHHSGYQEIQYPTNNLSRF